MVILYLLVGFTGGFASAAYALANGFAWYGVLGLYSAGGVGGMVLAGALALAILPRTSKAGDTPKADNRAVTARHTAGALRAGGAS